MLRIRPEQMRALEAAAAASWVEKTATRIARDFPERFSAPGADPKAFVLGSMERAEAYRVRSERAVEAFLDLECRFGPRFEQAPPLEWTREILLDHALDDGAKLFLIQQQLENDEASPAGVGPTNGV